MYRWRLSWHLIYEKPTTHSHNYASALTSLLACKYRLICVLGIEVEPPNKGPAIIPVREVVLSWRFSDTNLTQHLELGVA